MRSYNSSTSFIDFLFILLIGFVSLFIIAFLLINPIAKEGIIDPKSQVMIMVEWPKRSIVDIDTWIRGPDGTVVSYQKKDGKYIVLERDDLGDANDSVIVDGKLVTVFRNVEMAMINQLIPGEYVVNLHNYSSATKQELVEANKEEYPTPVSIRIMQLDPFKIIYETAVTLKFRDEKTVLTFRVNDDKLIHDKRTDVEIPLFAPFTQGPFNR